VGVTMDERIHNLLCDRGHSDLLLRVDDVGLGERLLTAMRSAHRGAEQVRAEILGYVPGELRKMGQMGIDLEEEVLRVYPDFPRRDVARVPENYLPPLSRELSQLMQEQA
jgi:hypothetical protein